MEATARFGELLRRPDEQIPLDEVALLMAAHADPGLDLPGELGRLDALAAACTNPTLDGLIRHLFVDEAFAGNRVNYYDPRNSFLNEVVSRRVGIPISLSVLAITIGRRLGVPLTGVGMPGHFLLRDKVDPDVFIDPFAAGAQLDRARCERAFRAVQGDDAVFHEEYLEPVSSTAIVARMLGNLRSVYAALGDRDSLTWVLRLRTLVPGVAPEERCELAQLLLAGGQFDAAAAELDALATALGGSLGLEYANEAGRLRARLN